MAKQIAHFFALLATAVALGPALAHLLELPVKIGMSREAYFTVQQIYAGWDRLAFVLLVQLASIVAVIVLSGSGRTRWFATGALAALCCAQLVFWIFTYPANAATENWTMVPENWIALRRQWEYSHAVGAFCQLIAMIALIASTLAAPSRKSV